MSSISRIEHHSSPIWFGFNLFFLLFFLVILLFFNLICFLCILYIWSISSWTSVEVCIDIVRCNMYMNEILVCNIWLTLLLNGLVQCRQTLLRNTCHLLHNYCTTLLHNYCTMFSGSSCNNFIWCRDLLLADNRMQQSKQCEGPKSRCCWKGVSEQWLSVKKSMRTITMVA